MRRPSFGRMLWSAGACVTLLLVVGCHQNRSGTRQHREQAAAPASDPPTQDQPGVSPPNAYRQRLTELAMEGLRYDSGRVQVDLDVAASIVTVQDPDAALVEYRRARQLLQRNALNDSLEAHTRAVLLDPVQAEYFEGLGEVLLAKRKPRQAAAALRTALDLEPGRTSARFLLAGALSRLDDDATATEQLRTVIAQRPDHGPAHHRLAILLYYGHDYPAAWRHVRRAEAVGEQLPPQFRALLTQEMQEPGLALEAN